MIKQTSSKPDPARLGSPDRGPRRPWQAPRGQLAVLGIVVVAAGIWWSGHGIGGGKPVTDQAVPVVVTPAYQGTFVAYLSEPGTVAPGNSVVVRSRVAGQLTRIAFTGGQLVKKGDLLAEIDPLPLQAQAQLAAGGLAHSQALLANAEETLRRYQKLLSQDSITQQRVADQQALVRQYAADVKADQGRMNTSNLQLSYARITAPISGVVGLRRVDPGNMVGPSDPDGIAVVTQSQPSRIEFAVPAAAAGRVLGRLRKGACIPVRAYADEQDEVLATGYLLAANNQVDPGTGTVKFEARFANAEGTLLPNQFVTVSLPSEVTPQATLVPTAAIQHGAAGAFVYVVKDDQTAAVAQVTLGSGDAATTVVKAGIAPGTKVVVEGADRLRAGLPVHASVRAAPAQPPADAAAECRRDEAEGSQHTSARADRSGAAVGRSPDAVASA